MSKSIKLKNDTYINKNSISMYPGHNQGDGVYSVPVTLKNFIAYANGSISSAGWYRLFKISNRDCVEGNSFILQLHSYYNQSNNASYMIAGAICFRSGNMIVLNKKANDANTFTNVRIAKDSSNGCYIDVYYNKSVTNTVAASLIGYNSALESYSFIPQSGSPEIISELDILGGPNLSETFSKVAQFQFNGNTSTHYSSGACIPFMKTIYNNTDGDVQTFSDGIIDVGRGSIKPKFVKITINLWLNNPAPCRPWLQLCKYVDGTVLATAIASPAIDTYQTLIIPEVIFPFEPAADGIMRLAVKVALNSSYCMVDSGIGKTLSYIHIELLY